MSHRFRYRYCTASLERPRKFRRFKAWKRSILVGWSDFDVHSLGVFGQLITKYLILCKSLIILTLIHKVWLHYVHDAYLTRVAAGKWKNFSRQAKIKLVDTGHLLTKVLLFFRSIHFLTCQSATTSHPNDRGTRQLLFRCWLLSSFRQHSTTNSRVQLIFIQ